MRTARLFLDQPVAAVVEIAGETHSELLTQLLSLAYRASRRGIVVLVLRNIAPGAIDRLLDPVVRQAGSGVRGLLYLDSGCPELVREAVQAATAVLVYTEHLASTWPEGLIAPIRLDEAMEVLASMGAPDFSPPAIPYPPGWPTPRHSACHQTA